MGLRASIVIPALNEKETIGVFLSRIDEVVSLPVEVIVVVDSKEDNTLHALEDHNGIPGCVKSLISSLPPGPANAIKYGISQASSDVIVVAMADGSDDPEVIDNLVRLIERGCVIASASRYMPGGQQIGGPRIKRFLSRTASQVLRILLGVSTHDATNSFKAYSKTFIDQVGIDSDRGFELGIELVAKAHRRGYRIAEVPTIWIDRSTGESNFQLKNWLPRYLYWFFYAFGKRIEKDK